MTSATTIIAKTQRESLLKPIQIVSGIVERRQILPILGNILIQKKGAQLSFLSTDLEIQISAGVDCGLGDSEIATTVAARKLLDIIRSIDEGEITLSLCDQRLIVQSANSRFTLQTLPAENFPLMAHAQETTASITLGEKTFRHLLEKVYFAMALSDIRHCLNATLLVIEPQQLSAVALDGHRLAYCSMLRDATGNTPDIRHQAILPRKTVLELQRLLAEEETPITITLAPQQITFHLAHSTLVSKLHEGAYPDYLRLIPAPYPNTFSVNRESWQRALQRASLFTQEKSRGIRCIIEPGQLKIYAHTLEQEEAFETLAIDYNGDTLEIGINVSYLLDVLAHLAEETVSMSLGGAQSSALITLPEQEHFKYVVMPMRI